MRNSVSCKSSFMMADESDVMRFMLMLIYLISSLNGSVASKSLKLISQVTNLGDSEGIMSLYASVPNSNETQQDLDYRLNHQKQQQQQNLLKQSAEFQLIVTSDSNPKLHKVANYTQSDSSTQRYPSHYKKHKRTSSKILTRPYDIDFSGGGGGNLLDMYKPLDKHQPYSFEQGKLREKVNAMAEENTFAEQKPPKLIRTQHRPPWRYQASQRYDVNDVDEEGSSNQDQLDLMAKKHELRHTTAAPITLSTTEFFKLISSAHSPIDFINIHKPTILTTKRRKNQTKNKFLYSTTSTSTTTTTTSPTTPEPKELSAVVPEGKVISPAITVTGGEEPDSDLEPRKELKYPSFVRHKEGLITKRNNSTSSSSSNTNIVGNNGERILSTGGSGRDVSSFLHFDDDQSELSPEFTTQLTPKRGSPFLNNNRPVTIIRFPPRRKRPIFPIQRPTESPQQQREPLLIVSADKITVTSHSTQRVTTTYSPQLVRLVLKQKYKYDDKVLSPTLTVVDNDAIRLPPNATSVHNNKLIVAIRPGRPKRPPPSTTQFPVYNIVAGITPPYSSNPSTSSYARLPSISGSYYGLLKPSKPSTAEFNATTPMPSNFAPQNIKFPANDPYSFQSSNYSGKDTLPDRFNLTVTGDLHGQNKLPDKIIIDAGENLIRPPDALVTSDTTIVARPTSMDTVMNQSGIIKVKPTLKPQRGAHTTPKVSIVSANTTIVAGNAEELHDVLSNVIAGSHHHNHAYQNQRPSTRPSFFSYIAGIFSNGIVTTIIGALSVIKLVFIALLAMFLPPMALAAAIMQVVNIG